MRRKPPDENLPDEPPVKVDNKLGTVANPPAADEFWGNLLRIVDEIEAAREAEANARARQKDSSDAA